MGLLRQGGLKLLKWVSMIAGVFVGGTSCPAYGAPIPPMHDWSVVLENFSYTPSGPASPKDTIVFTAQTNKSGFNGNVRVLLGDPPVVIAHLNDSGYSPDVVPGDGIWTGTGKVPKDAKPGSSLPVAVELDWYNGDPGQRMDGATLDIVE